MNDVLNVKQPNNEKQGGLAALFRARKAACTASGDPTKTAQGQRVGHG